MTDIALPSPVERIARVLVAETLSPNGDGPDWSERGAVSDQVDSTWREQVDRAIAVLKTLREPTPEMVDAGRAAGSDPAEIWNAMTRAAVEQFLSEPIG